MSSPSTAPQPNYDVNAAQAALTRIAFTELAFCVGNEEVQKQLVAADALEHALIVFHDMARAEPEIAGVFADAIEIVQAVIDHQATTWLEEEWS